MREEPVRKTIRVMSIPPRRKNEQLPRRSLHEWSLLRPELIFIYEQTLPAGAADMVYEREEDFSAWLVRRGEVWLRCDGVERRAVAGQWMVCFGRHVEQKLVPNTRLLSLRLAQQWPDRSAVFEGEAVQVLEAAKHRGLEKLALSLLRQVVKVSAQEGRRREGIFLWRTHLTRLDYFSYLGYERRLLAWLGELTRSLAREGVAMRAPGESDPRLVRALHALNRLAAADRFPAEELSRMSGVTMGRLNAIFARAYGCTTHAYWERRRAERARHALEIPGSRVKEVAAELGFVQLSHFSAWFKRQTGTAPREYRQARAGNRPV